MSVLFSPKGGVALKVISLIAAAKISVDTAIYSYTNGDVSKALITAAHRGVVVRVIMDKMQTTGAQAKIHDALEQGVSGQIIILQECKTLDRQGPHLQGFIIDSSCG